MVAIVNDVDVMERQNDKVNPHHENIKELEINCQVTAMKIKFDAPDLHYFA